MSDKSRTRQQLIAEIASLRMRVAQLEDAKGKNLSQFCQPEQNSSCDALTGLPNRTAGC